jgi:hypothetical protein
MNKQTTERGRIVPRQEALSHLARVQPLYGRGSWREQHVAIYATDAQLRWAVEQHRDEFVAAGALALIRGRVFVVEPKFSDLLLTIAQREIGWRQDERERLAQAAATAAFGITG